MDALANSRVPDAVKVHVPSVLTGAGVAPEQSSFGGGVTVVHVLDIVKLPTSDASPELDQ